MAVLDPKDLRVGSAGGRKPTPYAGQTVLQPADLAHAAGALPKPGPAPVPWHLRPSPEESSDVVSFPAAAATGERTARALSIPGLDRFKGSVGMKELGGFDVTDLLDFAENLPSAERVAFQGWPSAKPEGSGKTPPFPWPTWPLPNLPAHTRSDLLADVKQKLMWAKCKAACLGRECGVMNGCNCGQCAGDKVCVKGKCCAPYECCHGTCSHRPGMKLDEVGLGAGKGYDWGCDPISKRCICIFSNEDCVPPDDPSSKGCKCPPNMGCACTCYQVEKKTGKEQKIGLCTYDSFKELADDVQRAKNYSYTRQCQCLPIDYTAPTLPKG